MIEIQGKYNTAKVFADTLDPASTGQLIALCNQPFTEGAKIRLMPDVHAGAGCTIGTTMTVTDKIVPNLVGVDIGCGMHVVRLTEQRIDFARLDRVIRDNIPSGMRIREKPHPMAREFDAEELRCYHHVSEDRAIHSVGTLGGGNHFIEIDQDDEGNLYLVIHSGSRYLGKQIAEYYQKLGYDRLNQSSESDERLLVAALKREGRTKDISAELKKLKNVKRTNIPRELAYVEGKDLDDYLHDVGVAQSYADLNRRAMARTILKEMKLHEEESFTTIHNYIDLDHGTLRKGAVSAMAGERLLIPINMRDGSLLCVGKGNEDWNCSAPHGAGRLMSRSEAKNHFTVSQFKKEMEGIFTTSVGADTLDESPMVYKPMEAILSQLGSTAEVEKILRPLYNFKAGREE
ncbi:MAG: RtcB family protein [Clostridia bacterium]|nr:RtcB family protein [Clostridia bacterium]